MCGREQATFLARMYLTERRLGHKGSKVMRLSDGSVVNGRKFAVDAGMGLR